MWHLRRRAFVRGFPFMIGAQVLAGVLIGTFAGSLNETDLTTVEIVASVGSWAFLINYAWRAPKRARRKELA